jgi:hypothetical protein
MHALELITPQAVLAVLRSHVGSAAAVKSPAIAAKILGEAVPHNNGGAACQVRHAVGELRKQGHCICSMNGIAGGYYFAATEQEVERTCALLQSQANSMIDQIARLRAGSTHLCEFA